MRYFSSPGSPLQPIYSVEDTLTGGFPHSEIHGSKLTRSSPRHIAACHVLHRLLTPRHPPNALLALEHHHMRTPSPRVTMYSAKSSRLTMITKIKTELYPDQSQPNVTYTINQQCQRPPSPNHFPASNSSSRISRTQSNQCKQIAQSTTC